MGTEISSNVTATLIVPAHNEQASIARLLTQLLAGAKPREFEIIVVCNGCTDNTAAEARQFPQDVTVLETATPSKQHALRCGNLIGNSFPRLYIDADVEIKCADIRLLVNALQEPTVLAAAPARSISRANVSAVVRGYYDVWEQLPQVRSGLFGRGVIAMSERGYVRVGNLDRIMSDDLAISEAFAPHERVIVERATVRIRPPKTLRDLLRRRIRVRTGNAQFDQMAGRSADSKTSVGELLRIIRRHPTMALRMPVFVGVAAISRASAQRMIKKGDFTTWLRDDSSREGP